MQSLIFFVGPDMCGKTEISQELSKRLGIPYFKATSEHTTYLSEKVSKNKQFLNQLRFADPRICDLLRQTGYSVIFDRGYPCEFVYSKILGRKTDIKMLKYVDQSWTDLNAKIVFCHRSSYKGIVDDMDPLIDENKLQELHNAYEEFFGWSKCNRYYLNVDDEDLDREINELSKFLFPK